MMINEFNRESEKVGLRTNTENKNNVFDKPALTDEVNIDGKGLASGNKMKYLGKK